MLFRLFPFGWESSKKSFLLFHDVVPKMTNGKVCVCARETSREWKRMTRKLEWDVEQWFKWLNIICLVIEIVECISLWSEDLHLRCVVVGATTRKKKQGEERCDCYQYFGLCIHKQHNRNKTICKEEYNSLNLSFLFQITRSLLFKSYLLVFQLLRKYTKFPYYTFSLV